MRPAGALVDRLGPAVTSVAIALFAGSALLPAVATSPLALAGALLVLGALSGVVDVAINAEAAHAEAEGQPAMNLAHAVFSASVVGASVLVGVLRTLDADAIVVLGTVAALLVAVDVALTRIRVPRVRDVRRAGAAAAAADPAAAARARRARGARVPGGERVAELERRAPREHAGRSGGHRGAGAGAVRRLGRRRSARRPRARAAGRRAHPARRGRRDRRRRHAARRARRQRARRRWPGSRSPGSACRSARRPCSAWPGASCDPEQRGSAVSAVTTLAYTGFLIGPAAVGLVAGATSLSTALACVAGVAALLAALATVRAGATRLTFCRGRGARTRRSAHCRVRRRGRAWTA